MLIASIVRKLASALNRQAFVDRNSQIGTSTYLGAGVMVTNSSIGNYCSIGPRAMIGMGEHDLTDITTSTAFSEGAYEQLTAAPCIIRNDVWIGAGAQVLRGVTVGNGAVIGAGAIVTKDVPEFAVVVGVPAKVIRYRFREELIEKISESNWYSLGYSEAKDQVEVLRKELL